MYKKTIFARVEFVNHGASQGWRGSPSDTELKKLAKDIKWTEIFLTTLEGDELHIEKIDRKKEGL